MIEPRRGPGRPRIPNPKPRGSTRPVRLDIEIDDALCRIAIRHEVSIHALLKLAARMLADEDEAFIVDALVEARRREQAERKSA